MTLQEFDLEFDALYNNISSNQAPGLNSYEKSIFLTQVPIINGLKNGNISQRGTLFAFRRKEN